MRLEPASEATKQILDGIRKQIANGQTIHLKKNASGWQYGGKEFNENVESLRQQMQQELENQGFNVVGCTVRHFVKGANILNYLYPAKRILMIPINGISTLSTGGESPPDKYCYIEGPRPTLAGENIDVVFIGFEIKDEYK